MALARQRPERLPLMRELSAKLTEGETAAPQYLQKFDVMKQYNRNNIPLAKELRKNMTPWERKLWYEYLRYYPVRFQRQKAIGNYIADFYCAKARLIIELDGGGHYEPKQMFLDSQRTAELESMNLRVIRICNLDIDRNLRGVCEFIDTEVRKSLPQSP